MPYQGCSLERGDSVSRGSATGQLVGPGQSVLFVKKIGQWELSSEAKRSTRALPQTYQIFWTVTGWSIHSPETLFLDNMSVPWFIFARHMRCLQWAQIVLSPHSRSFASVQSRFETRPPWWFMYDTTDLLSERTSTWCPRKNWPAWHTASISRQWCVLLLSRLLLRWPLRRRPFEPELIHSLCHDATAFVFLNLDNMTKTSGVRKM